jgi:predicted ATP-grasp superfamily ATP-dependent carboligase
MFLDVLLTDGNYKHTYAMVRALRKKDLTVGVLFPSRMSLSWYSRFVSKRFLFSTTDNGIGEEEQYINELLKILKMNKVKVLIPVGNISFKRVLLNKEKILNYTKLAIAPKKSMEIAQNKNLTFKFAENIQFPMPKTFYPRGFRDLECIENKLRFPCIIKKTNPEEKGVIYCNNSQELYEGFRSVVQDIITDGSYPIIQEYIDGISTGFYALYKKGKCVSFFMHERVHELPITGGASTLAKSIYDQELKLLGERILDKLNWHGPVMVEFMKDRNNRLKLIEINPKFWGSMELSYTAGINFTHLYYLLALNKDVPLCRYKTNVYFRWTLPFDLIWKSHVDNNARKRFKNFKRNIKYTNNIHLDDPLTIIFNLFLFMYFVLTKKRYPYGKPSYEIKRQKNKN